MTVKSYKSKLTKFSSVRDSSSEVGGPPFFKNIHKCHAPGDNARSTAANAENVPVGAANLATYLSPRKSKFSMLPLYSTLDISVRYYNFRALLNFVGV